MIEDRRRQVEHVCVERLSLPDVRSRGHGKRSGPMVA
jgi:hypothetical protein